MCEGCEDDGYCCDCGSYDVSCSHGGRLASAGMLEAAITALIPRDEAAPCPFLVGGPLFDEIHVDSTDPECYSFVAFTEQTPAEYAATGSEAACRACIREALEERAIAAREAAQA